MTIPKDDPHVIEFMALFGRLQEMIDDDPSGLGKLAEGDKVLTDLCFDLLFAAAHLSVAERHQRQSFAAPVDVKFIRAWRNYEERYAFAVGDVYFSDVIPGESSEQKTRLELRWEQADESAEGQAKAIEGALDFAEDQATDEWRGFTDDFRESIKEGIAAWSALSAQTGFDLRSVFRRRELVPFVLIPRHVSQHHGPAERVSLLTFLQQAHDAFIFGVPFASVALMRSILEVVLRDHYHAQGSDISELIQDCRGLPPQASKSALHRLRHLANDILHSNKEQIRLPPDLEKEVLQLLHVLRALIEGAPIKGKRE